MTACQHSWDMVDVHFGFVTFEKCFHCNRLRTFFSPEPLPLLGDEYREGDCYWSRVENAQSFRFGLRCTLYWERHDFDELMGLLYCTGCDPECQVEVQRRLHEAEGSWSLVGFGFIEKDQRIPVPPHKLEILADYFNQRRSPARPRLRLLSFELIGDLKRCTGDFLHDVGMLSQEAPPERRPPFATTATAT